MPLPRLEHTAISHLSIPQLAHGILNPALSHRKKHSNRLGFMLGREHEHVRLHRPWSNDGALHSDALGIQQHFRNPKVVWRHGQREDLHVGVEGREQGSSLWKYCGSNKEGIYQTAHAHSRFPSSSDELGGA